MSGARSQRKTDIASQFRSRRVRANEVVVAKVAERRLAESAESCERLGLGSLTIVVVRNNAKSI